jgi:hypothetical protein
MIRHLRKPMCTDVLSGEQCIRVQGYLHEARNVLDSSHVGKTVQPTDVGCKQLPDATVVAFPDRQCAEMEKLGWPVRIQPVSRVGDQTIDRVAQFVVGLGIGL